MLTLHARICFRDSKTFHQLQLRIIPDSRILDIDLFALLRNHRAHFGIISNHFEPRAWSPLRNKGEYIQVW